MVVEGHTHLRVQLRQVEMGQEEGLKVDNQMLFGRKNVVVGELDEALEILAATFGVELQVVVLYKMSLMLVFVGEAMHTRFCRIDEAAGQMMVFGAIVELYVPTYRDEKHHKCQDHGTDLQDSFFHAAKIQKKHTQNRVIVFCIVGISFSLKGLKSRNFSIFAVSHRKSTLCDYTTK